MSDIVWIAVVGLIAGFIARLVLPGPNNPAGFLVTMALGIAGAFVATFIGQTIGWYRHDQGAGADRCHTGLDRRAVYLAPIGGPARCKRSWRHSRKLAYPAAVVS
jgi:uncharacterized membrane protein YeaQ/YmgE (transglycosylase-associated protein family)